MFSAADKIIRPIHSFRKLTFLLPFTTNMPSFDSDGTETSITPSSLDERSLEYRLIRPCERYEDEYTECKSSKSRRQQIFVHGQTIDCESWERDFKNCNKWAWSGDEEAARSVIESEKQRLRTRLKPHMASNVWSKRNGAPPDWNKPLPEFEEKTKSSYLAQMVKNDKEEGISPKSSGCVIQ